MVKTKQTRQEYEEMLLKNWAKGSYFEKMTPIEINITEEAKEDQLNDDGISIKTIKIIGKGKIKFEYQGNKIVVEITSDKLQYGANDKPLPRCTGYVKELKINHEIVNGHSLRQLVEEVMIR
jgi:hypothetical protein